MCLSQNRKCEIIRRQAYRFTTTPPSNDTLADGSYPLCNDFYAVIHPDAAADSPERRLYDWLDTDAGQDCIKKSGYVAVGPQTTVTIVD